MLRILRFSTHRSLSPEEAHRALEVARAAATIAQGVPGVRSCTAYADPELLVLTADCCSCIEAEDALKEPRVQEAIDRLAADFGYVMCDDEFVAPPVQGVVTA
jgi:hypothetical protein